VASTIVTDRMWLSAPSKYVRYERFSLTRNPRLRFPVQKIEFPDLETVKEAVMILGTVSNKSGFALLDLNFRWTTTQLSPGSSQPLFPFGTRPIAPTAPSQQAIDDF